MNIKAIAGGAALLLVGIAIGASGGSSDKPKEATFQAGEATTPKLSLTPSTTAETTTTTAAPTTTTTEAPTTTTTTGPPRWVVVSKLTGTGDKNGPVFNLRGGQQRVKYSCSMPADGYVGATSFYAGSDNFSCETEEDKPSASGDSMLYEDAGSYHFKINATPNNSWAITIEEMR